jgi:phenylacetate-CoA ligase
VRGLAPHFQLVLSRPERLDELTVRVESRVDAASHASREASGAELARLVKETVGMTVSVDVVEPGQVERSAGKAQRVVDLR